MCALLSTVPALEASQLDGVINMLMCMKAHTVRPWGFLKFISCYNSKTGINELIH